MEAKLQTPLTFRYFLAVSLFISLTFLSSCDTEKRTTTYFGKISYEVDLSTFRALSVSQQPPTELSNSGAIYVYGNYLFINERGKGIHIVDNTNPSIPKNLSFLPIEGNQNMAVNSNILYADNYIDLLAFDISDPQNIKLVKRVEDVFLEAYSDNQKTRIRLYKDTIITNTYKEEISYNKRVEDLLYLSSSGSYGQGGSLARFTLLNDHLYAIDHNDMRLFSVSNASSPKYLKKITLGAGIETIFPADDKLFIGSTTGMHIYDAAIPSQPAFLSTYTHVSSCDPVIVDGKLAYVTLRSGNMCQAGSNQLQVINIENPKSPALIRSNPMNNPHGLTISGESLYLCDGASGLKVFNKTSLKTTPNLLHQIKEIYPTDVLATPKSLIVTAYDGIHQYDYSNPSKLIELSHLQLSKPQYDRIYY
ncbi:MAG: hypothetical protein H7Y13_03165 [Sphingobacteriaceae bacterium]|nr:hypothetical protein [Sphingobacteriaceae bacterium]